MEGDLTSRPGALLFQNPLMKYGLLGSTLTALTLAAVSPARSVDTPLPRSTPEAQGISSQAICEFVESVDQRINTLHSFMVVRHGHVVAEGWWKPEAADKPHILMLHVKLTEIAKQRRNLLPSTSHMLYRISRLILLPVPPHPTSQVPPGDL